MPASVHKILFHGAIIIKNALLPIGQLSEEVIEARQNFDDFDLTMQEKRAENAQTKTLYFLY